jgi:hypothetical protein
VRENNFITDVPVSSPSYAIAFISVFNRKLFFLNITADSSFCRILSLYMKNYLGESEDAKFKECAGTGYPANLDAGYPAGYYLKHSYG